AIGMLLSLLTWTWQITAAVIGGVGFGLFIDELGKFLASDNYYSFKPTASLVYAMFIVRFLTARELRQFRKLTARENLVNAIEASKQLVLGPISNVLRNRALAWLDASDSSQPLTPFLHHQFELATATPERRFWFTAPVLAVRARYALIVHNRWFPRVVISVFVLQASRYPVSRSHAGIHRSRPGRQPAVSAERGSCAAPPCRLMDAQASGGRSGHELGSGDPETTK